MEKLKQYEYLKWIGISVLVVSSYLLLGAYHIGPLSLRLLVSYGLWGYTFIFRKTDYRLTKDMEIYLVYLAFFIIISILNSSAFKLSFIKNLIAHHFVCCTAIFAFPRFFKTETSIRGAFIVLVAIYLLNAFVTYLQFIDSPLGWEIGMYINPVQIEDLEDIQSYINNEEDFQYALLMGIMGSPVANGYIVATLLPVVTCFVWDKIGPKTILAVIMFVIAGACIYMVQQRMALVVAAFYIIILLVFKDKNLYSIIWFIIASFILIVLFIDLFPNFDLSDLGRLGYMKDEVRMDTFSVLIDFLSDPRQVLLGYNRVGLDDDLYVFHTMGHNTILDALRRGGIFLLSVYVVLYFHLCRSIVTIVRFSISERDYRTLGMALGCLCYLLYSLTHSTGVQSGGIMFWTLYMLTIQSHRIMYESLESEKESFT